MRSRYATTMMVAASVITAINVYTFVQVKNMGAQAECEGAGWKRVYGAPRDGTVIELCSTYGTEPWYTFAKWGKQYHLREAWEEQPDGRYSVSDSATLWWRPIPEGGKVIVRMPGTLYPGEEFLAGVIELPEPKVVDDAAVWEGGAK